MFKFAIRIFVVAAIGYVAGSQLVERSLMYLLDSVSADLSYQAVRGQMHVLRTELDSIAPAARAERLRDDIQPLYGLGLGLLADADVTPSTEEQRQLATLGIIMRDD
jgi:two-component system sensor kinase ParS